MSDKKGKDPLSGGSGNKQITGDESRGTAASRARNKTVMLSPEMTGQVRAMLQDDVAPAPKERARVDTGEWGGSREPLIARDPMDALFSGSDRFEQSERYEARDSFDFIDRVETRSTSVLDADALAVPYEESEEHTPSEVSGGFDPLTSLVSSAPPPPLSGRARQERSMEREIQVEPEAVPAPAVEQPASSGFAPVRGNPNTGPRTTAPAAPVASSVAAKTSSGPEGWHSVVSLESPGKLVGLLVSYDVREEGEIFEIRSGRFLITSRPTDNGDYLLINDASISPLHAIVRATEEGKIQVLDQLSEFGTGLRRSEGEEEEEVAGGLATVSHGDTVRFGKRLFVVVSIPKVQR